MIRTNQNNVRAQTAEVASARTRFFRCILRVVFANPCEVRLRCSGHSTLYMSRNGCSNVGVRHVGLYAKDPLVSAQFYRDILGMQTVGGTPGIGASAFLSSRPGEES